MHSVTEQMIMNPLALPECMRDMRCYRIEYGGFNESCVMECIVYLPAHVPPDMLEVLLNVEEKDVLY